MPTLKLVQGPCALPTTVEVATVEGSGAPPKTDAASSPKIESDPGAGAISNKKIESHATAEPIRIYGVPGTQYTIQISASDYVPSSLSGVIPGFDKTTTLGYCLHKLRTAHLTFSPTFLEKLSPTLVLTDVYTAKTYTLTGAGISSQIPPGSYQVYVRCPKCGPQAPWRMDVVGLAFEHRALPALLTINEGDGDQGELGVVLSLPMQEPNAPADADPDSAEKECRKGNHSACADAALLWRSQDPPNYALARELLALGCKANDGRSCMASFDFELNERARQALHEYCGSAAPDAWLACVRENAPDSRDFTYSWGSYGHAEDLPKPSITAGFSVLANWWHDRTVTQLSPELGFIIPAVVTRIGVFGLVIEGRIPYVQPLPVTEVGSSHRVGTEVVWGLGAQAGIFYAPFRFVRLEIGGLYSFALNDSASSVGLDAALTFKIGSLAISGLVIAERVPVVTESSGSRASPLSGEFLPMAGGALSWVVPTSF